MICVGLDADGVPRVFGHHPHDDAQARQECRRAVEEYAAVHGWPADLSLWVILPEDQHAP